MSLKHTIVDLILVLVAVALTIAPLWESVVLLNPSTFWQKLATFFILVVELVPFLLFNIFFLAEVEKWILRWI